MLGIEIANEICRQIKLRLRVEQAVTQLGGVKEHADVSVLGLLLCGIIPMLYYRRRYASEYYTQKLERVARELSQPESIVDPLQSASPSS